MLPGFLFPAGIFAHVLCFARLIRHFVAPLLLQSYPFLIKFNSANMKGEWPGEQYEKAHETDALLEFAKAGRKDEL